MAVTRVIGTPTWVDRPHDRLANHTYSHHDLKKMSDSQIAGKLGRNEDWVQSTLGVTTRPWHRPPFGFHNSHTDGVAGRLGYTNVRMWNGSFGDSNLLTPEVLMGEARKYVLPGTIMLGHANHPTVTDLFGELRDLIADRNLTPVTLDEMFGTSRRTG